MISMVRAFVHVERADKKNNTAMVMMTSRHNALLTQTSTITGARSIAEATHDVTARLKERKCGPIRKIFRSCVTLLRPGFNASGRKRACYLLKIRS
jgi:hypothetical protein